MNLEPSIDDLFELSPDRFTAARDQLAKVLRDGGDRESASSVKALRKPTLIAWALNQLSRRERPALESLIESGEALRAAQRKALTGVEAAPFRAAMEQRRKLVRQLTRRGMQILREAGRGPQAAEEEIARTLETVSTDAEAATAMLQGRLEKPLSGSSGFEAFSGLSLVPDPSGSEVAERAERKARETELKNAERQAEKATIDARRARLRADTLARELEEIGRRSEEAAEEAGRLEREADEARGRLEALRGRS